MLEGIVDELEYDLENTIQGREKRIGAHLRRLKSSMDSGDSGAVYTEIAEISRHTEHMVRSLRELMIDFYSTLQISGVQPANRPLPSLPDVNVRQENGCIIITMGAMLPFPLKAGVYCLHDKLDTALERFCEDKHMPRPYFTERCAVVFLHHHGSQWRDLRHLRDYDNVEHRCITNVLAAHLLWGIPRDA